MRKFLLFPLVACFLLTGCECGLSLGTNAKAFYPGSDPRSGLYGPGYSEQPGHSIARGYGPGGN